MKKGWIQVINRMLIVLHIIVGIGALVGGLAAITNPINPLGVSAELYLKHSPFKDFLIPGIILFSVIGLGNLVGALCIGLKIHFNEYVSGVCAGALVIWIIVQCIMLYEINFLHVLFFGIGAIQGLLVFTILLEKRLFPANILLSIWEVVVKNKQK